MSRFYSKKKIVLLMVFFLNIYFLKKTKKFCTQIKKNQKKYIYVYDQEVILFNFVRGLSLKTIIQFCFSLITSLIFFYF